MSDQLGRERILLPLIWAHRSCRRVCKVMFRRSCQGWLRSEPINSSRMSANIASIEVIERTTTNTQRHPHNRQFSTAVWIWQEREQRRADKFWALKAHFALGTSRQCQDMTVTASGQNNHLGRGDIPFKAGNDRLKGRAVDLAFGRSTVMDFVVNVVQFSH